MAAPQIAVLGSELFFAASDGSDGAHHGLELWKSDGTSTPGHTVLVADLNPGPGDSNPTDLTVFNGQVYFAANDGTHGTQLWKSNGATAVMVTGAPINPTGDANIGNLTVVGAKLFFTGNDGTHGGQLWVTDGATATQLIINSLGGAGAGWLTAMGSELFFSANDG